jgi:VanZ family protein
MPMYEKLWNRRWLRILTGALTAAVMAVIFLFSAQNGETSHEVSGFFIGPLLRLVAPGYDLMPAIEQEGVWQSVEFFVRKAGHFLEFAALGFCLRMFLQTFPLKYHSRWAWLGATLYAATDELHQVFTASRTPLFHDVLIDSSGALAGVVAGCLLAMLIERTVREREERIG